jgi:pyruvate formate lyase activating enzyme
MIFNIQRFSTHDGEGIRTLIFYKGCPLRCAWCCNPESQSFDYSILYDRRKCKSFGDCIAAGIPGITNAGKGLEIIRSEVPVPEILRNVCLSRAIQISGEERSTDELLYEIEKDLPFYRHSGGGVTLSGGEPLSQGESLVELLAALKDKNLDVAMETSLHVEWAQVERCMGLVGTFLVDIKHTDPEKFRVFTGGNLHLVNANLKLLVEAKENVIVRIPVIPGFNHTTGEMEKIVDFAGSLHHIREIHFLPYHTLGTEKYAMLGMDYAFGIKTPVDENTLNNYINYARYKGFTVKTGG